MIVYILSNDTNIAIIRSMLHPPDSTTGDPAMAEESAFIPMIYERRDSVP